MERWRQIPGFEGLYEVSDLGRVRAVKNGGARVKAPQEDRGYLFVTLFDGARSRRAPINRLVLEAFVGPAPENHDGAHLDGSRGNNRLENLAWVSRADNQLHRIAHGTSLWGQKNPNAKLTAKQIAEIKALYGICGPTELAQRYGVGRTAIQKIVRGETWRDVEAEKLSASVAAIEAARQRKAS